MAPNQGKAAVPSWVAVFSGILITLLTLLSMIAVGSLQWESYSAQGVVKYWYVVAYGLCEIWVALGLCLLAVLIQKKEWLAVMVALALWLPAMGVSAVQEHRFHVQRIDSDKRRLAPDLERHRQATVRLDELMTELAALPPQRPLEAIDAELERYGRAPDRYPTKLATLRSERTLSAARDEFTSEKKTVEATLMETVSVAIVTNPYTVQDWSLWALVLWMMGVKAGGAWLLTRAVRPGNHESSAAESVPVEPIVLSSEGKPMRLIS